MGKFFNTLHVSVYNKEAFARSFEWIMKKEGFVPCVGYAGYAGFADCDEAEVTFAAAFSEGGWVSLSYNEESAGWLSKLSERLAKDLKLASFTVEAVDSDFAILELHAPGGRKSRLVVGDGEGYGVEKAPLLIDDWRPFFQNGGVEEFLAAAGQNGAFVEDALCELGKILGIKPAVMAWCFDEFEEKIGRGGEVISLAFKKKAGKKLTLNAAFKKVFGEALEPLGYRLIKGKYPYYVRVVPGGEIVHIVAVARNKNGIGGRKAFDIKCGVATVYRKQLDFDIPTNEFALDYISQIYTDTHHYDLDMKYRASIMRFEYDTPIPHFLKNNAVEFTTDDNEMLDSLKKALEAVKQVFLPVVNEVTSLMDCEKYYDIVGQHSHPKLDFGGEGLFLMKLFSSAEDFYQFKESEALRELKGREFICNKAGGDFSSEIKIFDERREERRKYWVDMFNDTKLQSKFPEELERRRKENTEKLREYGPDI